MILELNHINTFYGETQVLYDVSLAVGRGEVVSLLGPNGAGKTTTLRSILGLTPAREGTITFDGAEITSIARKRSRFRAWDLNETFEIFTALEYLMERECENLSGGEMQMVAISRALLGSPGLVLFDEPTQGLAPKVAQDVMAVVKRLKEEQISVLLVEHNAHSALAVSDRVYVMDLGRIVHTGSAAELLADDALRRKLLGI
jgi:branched-chain amino acid transport system ATP-binding protein